MNFHRLQRLRLDRNRPREGIVPEKSKRTFPIVESIEAIARRSVSIETRLNDNNLAKCNLQEQSPLFKLPAELRNLIFEYACLPYDTLEDKYNDTNFYYRPEHQARHLTSYSILLTCRRAWLEANHLPMQFGDHTFWFRDPGRRPQYLDSIHWSEGHRMDRFIRTLTINNRKHLTHVKIHGQMVWLEESLHLNLPLIIGSFGVCPNILTITIKHSDWFWWENDRPLRLKDAWVSQLLTYQALPRLREIRIEFETLESKMKELRAIVAELREKFDVILGTDQFGEPCCLRLQESPPERTWSGTTRLGGKEYPHYKDLKQLDYRIATLVWKVTSYNRTATSETGAEDDCESLTHIPGPQLTDGTVDYPDHRSARSSISSEDREVQECLRRWIEHRSLLKFAPSAPALRIPSQT